MPKKKRARKTAKKSRPVSRKKARTPERDANQTAFAVIQQLNPFLARLPL